VLAAIRQINTIAQKNHSQLLLAMTPLLREIGQPGSRDYEIVARQRLSDLVREQKIAYIDFLPIFQAIAQPKSLYLDSIHINFQGNQLVTQEIAGAVNKILIDKS
jgi:lysophospholipase L1-like esterase